jgi:signal transduction histidine kinase
MSNKKASEKAPRKTLLVKLVIAFVLPTVTLFSIFAVFAYEVQRGDLEEELGRRLESVASAAATRLRGKYLLDLEVGDEEDNPSYIGAAKRLQEVLAVTGVERLYVFDRQFKTKLDTSGTAIGERQFQAEIDRRELATLFEDGNSATSLLFEGVDKRPYKAGYAAVFKSEKDREIVLAIGADAPADFFERLADLRAQFILYGVFLVLAVAAVAILIGLRITRPVRSLAEAAERIGAGDLAEPIRVLSRDEIGLLAMTMEQMRSDLRARDERMQLMMAGIAHEVRNPLGGMELFSGILREELEGDEEKQSHVQRIEKEIGHLKTLVDNFLEYARRSPLDLVPVDLGELAQEVADLEAGELSKMQCELKLELESVSCLADTQKLRRAVLNLLRNAIQAGAESDKPVVLRVAKSDGQKALLSVTNFGSVIEAEVKEHIFEPFFTTKQKGTGLGLAFVKEIIADHGGTIELQSSAETGTCFTLLLPLSSAATTKTSATTSQPS